MIAPLYHRPSLPAENTNKKAEERTFVVPFSSHPVLDSFEARRKSRSRKKGEGEWNKLLE
tara:strand:- start:152 stop:331 length:180 start_codon:yes stop_codon:yes gene_type:complete